MSFSSKPDTFSVALLFLWALTLVGCEGDAARYADAVIATQQGITQIEIAPASRTLNPAETAQLTVLGRNAAGESITLTTSPQWSLANNSVASISNSGLVTALANGTTSITAEFAGLRASSEIIVSSATLESLAFVSPSSIDICRSTSFELEGSYSDGSKRPVSSGLSWFVDGVAASSNLITLSTAGTTTIEARSNEGPSISDSFTVVASLASITLDPSSLSLNIDDINSGSIATGEYPDGNIDISDAIVWENTQSFISVSAAGAITALNSGSGAITASCGGVSTSLPVTVSVDTIPTALEINNGDSITANAGDSVTLTLDAILSDGTRSDATADAVWSIDQRDIGLLISVSNDDGDEGEVTASGVGTAYVQASYEGKEEVIKITYQ